MKLNKFDKKITLAFYRFALKNCYKGAEWVTRLCVPVFAALFLLCAAYCAFAGGIRDALVFAAIPAANELITLLLRKVFRRQRPFETIPHTNRPRGCRPGMSFPSNHAASAFIITFAALSINEYIGFVAFILAIPVALSRIALAAHYATDVIFALLQSALISYIGYYLLSTL